MICTVMKKTNAILNYSQDIVLLGLRLLLAYTFYAPAMAKISDISATAMWFESMGIPLPTLNAYMAAGTEMAGVVLLTLGLMTRYISIPLIGVMVVAILTVHGVNGFSVIQEGFAVINPYVNGELIEGTVVVLQNGYELVLYYSLMLAVLVSHGGGRLSLDYFLDKKIENN
jgi:putative oxidoreductase